MRHRWLAYLVVAVLAVGVGVAVAGLPDTEPVGATISAPSDTMVPESETTDAPSSTTVTTAGNDSTAATPPTTAPADSTSPSTLPPTTALSTTAPSTTEPLPPRSDFFVIVANGNGAAGSAGRNIDRLQAVGYTDIAPRNGTELVDFTVVYHQPGLETAAARLAADLELLPEFVAPLADAPEVGGLPLDVELLAYLGRDRAD
jgi:hypothetical protein